MAAGWGLGAGPRINHKVPNNTIDHFSPEVERLTGSLIHQQKLFLNYCSLILYYSIRFP